MKKIEAIIRKSKFSEVRDALHQVDVNFFSYWDVTGIGNEKQGQVYRGISYSTSDIQRRFLSIVVNDNYVKKTIDAIVKSGATDKIGDGKIFVLPIEDAIRIRTGEHGGKTLNKKNGKYSSIYGKQCMDDDLYWFSIFYAFRFLFFRDRTNKAKKYS